MAAAALGLLALVVQGTDVYFGNGDFFHQQNILAVMFEQGKLNRTADTITSIAAYAGGKNSSLLCYHNENNTFDYASLGHAQVVGIDLPEDAVGQAAEVFFMIGFNETSPGTWTRRDAKDLGAEFRAVIGLPGGKSSTMMPAIEAANKHNLTLTAGKGSDGDTFYDNTVYIMDSNKFPFTQAELCLQFHDDAPVYEDPYPASYHQLKESLEASGRLQKTLCPSNYLCDGHGLDAR